MGNSGERKQGNGGERKSRLVGQSQNLSQRRRRKAGSQLEGREAAIAGEAEAGGSEDGSPPVVRGPERGAQGALLSEAALGPGLEATSP